MYKSKDNCMYYYVSSFREGLLSSLSCTGFDRLKLNVNMSFSMQLDPVYSYFVLLIDTQSFG